MNKHRLPLRFFLSGLLLLAAMLTPLKAGSITTSVTCTTSGGNTTNVAACSASAGQVNASSSATYLLSTNSLATTFTASASATPAGSLTSNAALANAAITLNLDTAGSERAGYVLIDWTANENSCCGIGGGSVVYDLGSGVGGSCGAPPSNVCHYQLFEPVTLGSDFTFTESEQFQATTLDENDGGNLSATLNLQFYEADKTTPVDVFETPEPSALSLIGMGLIFLVVARVRR